MTRSKGKAPSQRQLRVGELIRHELSRLINDGAAHDPALQGASVTVSEVRVSPDLKNATAFVMPLAGEDGDKVLPALRRAAPFFRRRLAEHVELRHTPRLSFLADSSFDEASRIARLLHSDRVRQDLGPRLEEKAAEGREAGESGQGKDEDGAAS